MFAAAYTEKNTRILKSRMDLVLRRSLGKSNATVGMHVLCNILSRSGVPRIRSYTRMEVRASPCAN